MNWWFTAGLLIVLLIDQILAWRRGRFASFLDTDRSTHPRRFQIYSWGRWLMIAFLSYVLISQLVHVFPPSP